MSTAIRCNGCGAWMPDDHETCELCGQDRPEHNPHLLKAKLDAHLYAMAEGTQNEARLEKELKQEEVRGAKRLGIEPERKQTPLTDHEKKMLGGS